MVCERLGREPFWRRGDHPHGSLLPSPKPTPLPPHIFAFIESLLAAFPVYREGAQGGFKVLPLRERAKPANAIKRYARARKGMAATASNAAKIAAQKNHIWRGAAGGAAPKTPEKGQGRHGRGVARGSPPQGNGAGREAAAGTKRPFAGDLSAGKKVFEERMPHCRMGGWKDEKVPGGRLTGVPKPCMLILRSRACGLFLVLP